MLNQFYIALSFISFYSISMKKRLNWRIIRYIYIYICFCCIFKHIYGIIIFDHVLKLIEGIESAKKKKMLLIKTPRQYTNTREKNHWNCGLDLWTKIKLVMLTNSIFVLVSAALYRIPIVHAHKICSSCSYLFFVFWFLLLFMAP